MKINTVDTIIQDWREGQNIFRRSSVELLVREISRLNKRIENLETTLVYTVGAWKKDVEEEVHVDKEEVMEDWIRQLGCDYGK